MDISGGLKERSGKAGTRISGFLQGRCEDLQKEIEQRRLAQDKGNAVIAVTPREQKLCVLRFPPSYVPRLEDSRKLRPPLPALLQRNADACLCMERSHVDWSPGN
jgi:hypothetical protein